MKLVDELFEFLTLSLLLIDFQLLKELLTFAAC